MRLKLHEQNNKLNFFSIQVRHHGINSHLVALINCTDETKPFITSPHDKKFSSKRTKLSWSKRFFMFFTFINFDEFSSLHIYGAKIKFSRAFHRYTCYFKNFIYLQQKKFFLRLSQNFLFGKSFPNLISD